MAKRSRALAVRSRTVVVRSTRRSSRSFRSNGRMKIPLAIIAGFIPSTAWAIDAGRQGNWQAAGERELAAFTGYEWGAKKFTFSYLNYGLWPVLAGVVVHGVANYIGANRFIGKLGLPVEI